MTLQERIMNKAGDKYVCLENEKSDNVDVITIANRDSDALLLNYEIGDSTISVNVINKQEGTVVDDYDTEYTDENFDDKIDTSISTYEAISKSFSNKLKESKKASYTDEDIEKFKNIIANGGSREIYKLSKEDLQKMYDFVYDCDDYKSARALILWQIQDAIDDFNRPEDKRRKFEDNDSEFEDITNLGDYSESSDDVKSCEELLNASIPDLLQLVMDKLDSEMENVEDDNTKIILDDVSAQLVEILDEVSSYVEE